MLPFEDSQVRTIWPDNAALNRPQAVIPRQLDLIHAQTSTTADITAGHLAPQMTAGAASRMAALFKPGGSR